MQKHKNPPKVCYVASPDFFSKGAYGVHSMEMCRAMEKLGVDFEAVVPGLFKTDEIFEYYGIKKPFKLKSLPFTKNAGRQFLHGISASFYAFENRRRFDIVLTRNIICAAFATRVFGLRVIYDAHHPPVNKASELLFKSFQDSPNLAAVSFNSGGLRNIYLKLGLGEGKTVVAHNGVDLSGFENRPPMAEIRKQLGLPIGKKIVCYCGNTYTGRGIESLVEIADSIKDAVFLIVGGRDTDNAPYIKAAKQKGLDNFFVKGFVPHSEVPLYLLASDVLALPYTKRATIKGGTKAVEFTSPMKLFEYMAAGKPIVATAIPTVCEILKDGEDSSVVAEGDGAGFEKALLKCLNDPEFAEKTGKRAREKVIREYQWEQRVLKILSFAGEKC